jgi:hypothetical protein
MAKIQINEGVAKLRVRRFSGLFWPIFRFFSGGNIRNVDITPEKKRKIGSKEPENRQNLSFATPSNSRIKKQVKTHP